MEPVVGNLCRAKVTWLRKHFIGIHPRDGEMITAAHDGQLTELLADYADGWNEETLLSADFLFVPREEFKQLITDLPEFKTLPILWAQWNDRGMPTEFVVKCLGTEDELAIDTQGYEYARYKSAIKWV